MSLTQAGVYVTFITFVLGLFKMNISNEEITQVVEAILTLIGLGMAFYGRYRRGDITVVGTRK